MRTICQHCNKFVNYNIISIPDKTIFSNEVIEYDRKVAICNECGNEVWVGELDDINAEAVFYKYLLSHKLGKIVYTLTNEFNLYEDKYVVIPITINAIELDENNKNVRIVAYDSYGNSYYYKTQDLGITIFYDKKSAENACKKKNNKE